MTPGAPEQPAPPFEALSGKPAPSSWRRKLLWAVAAGVVYGVCNYFSSKFHPPGCRFIEFRPQVAVLMYAGLVHGPWAGFVAGCLGDSLGYAIQGLGFNHAWNWSVGNGFIGMIPGLAPILGVTFVRTIRQFALLLGLVLAASSLPIFFAAGLDKSLTFSESLYSLILPASITDAIFGFLLVPPLLLLGRRLAVTVETRTILMTTYLLIPAVLLTYGASLLHNWPKEEVEQSLIRDFYNVGALTLLVLVAGLAVSAFLASRVTAPIVSLTTAASAVARGDYDLPPSLAKAARREDEIGQLANVFQDMASQVHARQRKLESQVQELKIEIDRARLASEVARITGADYFKRLRDKAQELRKEA